MVPLQGVLGFPICYQALTSTSVTFAIPQRHWRVAAGEMMSQWADGADVRLESCSFAPCHGKKLPRAVDVISFRRALLILFIVDS